jgi:hypothetical protein
VQGLRQRGQSAYEDHDGYDTFGSFDVGKYILFAFKIPKFPSEGNIRDHIESEELCFWCKVHKLEVSLGGKVFRFDEIYETCDIVVDRAFEVFLFFSKVLRMSK